MFWSSILKKTNTLPDQTIHITPMCIVHLHGHRNNVVSFMKHFILANLNNDTKFHNYTYWSTNDSRSHRLAYWINNHPIANEDLIFPGHVKIDS
jgi:hypothetical protein